MKSMFRWAGVPGNYRCELCGSESIDGHHFYRHLLTAHRGLSTRQRGLMTDEQRRRNGWPTGADYVALQSAR